MKIKLVIICGFLSLLSGCFSGISGSERMVAYIDTWSYRKRTNSFSISEREAHRLLGEAVKGRKGVHFSYRPMLLTESEYFFGLPRKGRIFLTGFYVDGFTGRIVYRESDQFLRGRGFSRKLPVNPFTHEEIVSP